jgi:hypothetical protein
LTTLITKSNFLRFLECPRYGWLYRNRPDLVEKTESHIAKQGDEVESLAHGLFEEGTKVPWENAVEITAEHLKKGTPVLYQATLKTDKYLARADILVKDPDGNGWHLYEVKSTSKEKKTHIPDLCFQTTTFEEAGLKLSTINLIHVNKTYRFDAQKGLEIKKFFVIEDLTQKVRDEQVAFAEAMSRAHAVLTDPEEPHPKILVKNFEYEVSPSFEAYYRQGIPEYSIYDIGYISKKELTKLTEKGIRAIEEIPDGFFKQEYKNLQVEVTKTKKPFRDFDRIAQTRATFQYPLYFLDYETVAPAIPIFDGTRPYQHLCFQYSLHVKRTPESALEHFEFLHLEKDNPVPHLLKRLRSDIGDQGTVFVWYEPFETTRNKEMAEDYAEYREFLENLNERVYDLMKIVSEGMYEDYRFKGSASIKKVLPVLVPELSYKELGVQHGGEAMDAWYSLMDGTPENKDQIIQDMLEYCQMDTLAMVRVLEVFEGVGRVMVRAGKKTKEIH